MVVENPLNSTVIAREDLHNELAIIKIRPDDGPVAPFKPGQFCTLGLPAPPDPDKPANPKRKGPKLIRRAYSIASSPKVSEYLEVFVVLVSEGRLTPNLWTVPVDGKLFMDPKIRGEFTLDAIPEGKDLVMASTGTGLAPFLSMLRTHRGENRWRRLVMIHGVRNAWDLGYREELERIAAEDESVFYIPVCSREPEDSDWAGPRGRVQAVLDETVFKQHTGFTMNPQDAHLFLCGNPAMITAVQEQFEARGFVTSTKKQAGNIHFERYW